MGGFAADASRDGSISTLEAAAAWRWDDAELLRERGRTAAALYWFGFTIEFRLTAALLRLHGYSPSAPVSLRDIDHLRSEARRLQLMGTEPHDLQGLARYLLRLRTDVAVRTRKSLGIELLDAASNAYAQWRPRMRYKPLVPTAAQFRLGLDAALWFRERYNDLWR
ncbi:hypothetical protein RAS1_10570 [Phycisphaerae bacterium RAS1]|nr:hypothetical protein RAS1_10570 [Phycisphaerae bacterium RAS1]